MLCEAIATVWEGSAPIMKDFLFVWKSDPVSVGNSALV
jgi:hypothetical protein